MSFTVQDLLQKPFLARSVEERRKILSEGKPQPKVNTKFLFEDKYISINELNDLEPWLTFCEKSGDVYCWACLLFPLNDSSVKGLIANNGASSLCHDIRNHKRYSFHIKRYCHYRISLKTHSISDGDPDKSPLQLNKTRHFEMLKRIVDAVCLLVDLASPLPKTITDGLSENCAEILTSLKSYDGSHITDEAINFVKKYPRAPAKTMEAVAKVMKEAIIKEMESCSHVSLILTEFYSSKKVMSRLSSMLRYLYKGNVCERFIDFKIVDSKTVDNTAKYIENLISEYEISTKLLSLSCDGAVPTEAHSSSLIQLFKEQLSSTYVPCYFHDIYNILEQRLSCFKEFGWFFKTLNCVKIYFRDNSKMRDAFSNFVKEKFVTDWNNFKLTNAQFLRILKKHRIEFIAFFIDIAQASKVGNKDDLAKAMGFQLILENYQTVFLIEAFHLLFSHLTILSEGNLSYNAFDSDTVDEVKKILWKEKLDGFENLWTVVATELSLDSKPAVLESISKNEIRELQSIFSKAIDCMVTEISHRYKNVRSLEFLSLLNCEAHDKLLVTDHQVIKLEEMHGASLICKNQLITEMDVLRKNATMFAGKSNYEIVDFLNKADLTKAFKNVYQLGEIIVSLPCKPVPHANNVSKSDVIDAWAYFSSSTTETKFRHLCIEKDYLELMRSRYDFYLDVVMSLREVTAEVRELF